MVSCFCPLVLCFVELLSMPSLCLIFAWLCGLVYLACCTFEWFLADTVASPCFDPSCLCRSQIFRVGKESGRYKNTGGRLPYLKPTAPSPLTVSFPSWLWSFENGCTLMNLFSCIEISAQYLMRISATTFMASKNSQEGLLFTGCLSFQSGLKRNFNGFLIQKFNSFRLQTPPKHRYPKFLDPGRSSIFVFN